MRGKSSRNLLGTMILTFILFSAIFQLLINVEASPITTNDSIGIIKVVEINSTNLSDVPSEIWAGPIDGFPMSEPYNISTFYNSTGHTIDLLLGPKPDYYGCFWLGGFMPLINTTYYFKFHINTYGAGYNPAGYAYFSLSCSLFTATVKYDPVIPKLTYYAYYYDPALKSISFDMTPEGSYPHDIELYINYDGINQTFMVGNGTQHLFTRYQTTYLYDYPLLSSPTLKLSVTGQYNGYWVNSHIEKIEQWKPRNYITILGTPQNWLSLGFDGPYDSMYISNGTDYLISRGFNASILFNNNYWTAFNESYKMYLRDLIYNKTFGTGLHSPELTTLSLSESLAVLNDSYNGVHDNITIYYYPEIWTALKGSCNITHTNFAYDQYCLIGKHGADITGFFSQLGGLGDKRWIWLENASMHNTYLNVNVHVTDLDPAPNEDEISYSNFTTWVDNYYNSGGKIVSHQYWHGVGSQSLMANVTIINFLDNEYQLKIQTGYSDARSSSRFYPAYIDVYDVNAIYDNNTTFIIGSDGNSVNFTFNVSTNSFRFLAENNITYSIGQINPNFTHLVNGKQTSFNPIQDGNDISYLWSFGDSTLNSTLQNPSHTYSSYGTFYVSLTVTDEYGASNSTGQWITVSSQGSGGGGEPPSVDFDVYESIWGLHFVPSISFHETPTNYTWYFGDGHTSTSRTPTHYYRYPGNYSVTLRITFERGGYREIQREISVGDHSALQDLLHSVELREDGLFVWIGSDHIAWPEIGLFIGGVALIANAWLSGREAERLRRRRIPDRMRGWRQVQYVAGAAMITAVLWIELVIKSGMVV